MSDQHRLPQEICDHIIDHFQDDPETLKQCCLVSKSWVPHTQKYLFSYVTFKSADYPKWRRAFPDLSSSPACYTHTLTVDGALGSAEERKWIESFSRVERLIVECTRAESHDAIFLDPFRGFAPSLKSLCVDSAVLPLSRVLSFIYSLPLLEDLILRAHNIDDKSNAGMPTPAHPPALTGAFELSVSEGMEVILCLLLGFRGGLHFRELRLSCCHAEGLSSVEELVMACSNTLESLDISCEIYANETSSIDLSKATRLKDIVFRCRSLNSAWVTMTLRTITDEHRNLRQISVYVPRIRDYWYDRSIINSFYEVNPPLRWSDLDHLLVEFWELRSIPSKVVCSRTRSGPRGARDWAKFFVPELMKKGVFDPVDVDEPRVPEFEYLE